MDILLKYQIICFIIYTSTKEGLNASVETMNCGWWDKEKYVIRKISINQQIYTNPAILLAELLVV